MKIDFSSHFRFSNSKPLFEASPKSGLKLNLQTSYLIQHGKSISICKKIENWPLSLKKDIDLHLYKAPFRTNSIRQIIFW